MNWSDPYDNALNQDRGRRLASYARAQVQRAARCENALGTSVLPDSPPGYTLHREVHRGGQGVVFEATQHSTKRRVAVKIMHEIGVAGVRRQARFEREIEILAQLRHPNIVAVHDGGVTTGGRFYLAMDFVDGEPIDDFLAGRELSVRDTVSLFLKVCDAVNTAHLRGVVHRDLKPSNIRVDRAGEPHVLDFGLAKIVESESERVKSAVTMTGEFIGTLHWTSPEQAEGDQDRIDVRSDVYALGVLLFHALTDAFPYDVVGPMSKVLASICQSEPVKPSRFRTELDDDVDTIVLKCLSKDPERRYQSAGELARDLERYLEHQPIAAKRDSTWYVLTRTIRRHRLIASLTVLALMGMIAFLVTTTILYRRAAMANAEALAQANRAAEIHREWVSHSSFLVENLAEVLSRLPESMALRRTVLETTLTAFRQLRQYDEKEPKARDGWARTQIAMSKMSLAVDRYAEADRYRRQALAVREQLAVEFPDNPDYQRSLALNCVLIGDLLSRSDQLAERREWYKRALALDQDLVSRFPDEPGYLDDLSFDHERIGHLFKIEGDLDNAQAHFDEQFQLAKQLVAMAPDRPASHWALLCSLGQQVAMLDVRGDARQAATLRMEVLANARRLIAMEPNNPDYIQAVWSTAGALASDLNEVNVDGALAALHEVEPLVRQLVALEPENHVRRSELTRLLLGFASAHLSLGGHSEAQRYAREALESLPPLPADDSPHQYRLEVTRDATEVLARVAFAKGDSQAQATYADQAIAAADALESMFAADASLLDSLAGFWATCPLPQICDPQRAEQIARKCMLLNGGAVPKTHYCLALALAKQGKVEEAAAAASRALEILPGDNLVMRHRVERLLESLDSERGP